MRLQPSQELFLRLLFGFCRKTEVEIVNFFDLRFRKFSCHVVILFLLDNLVTLLECGNNHIALVYNITLYDDYLTNTAFDLLLSYQQEF